MIREALVETALDYIITMKRAPVDLHMGFYSNAVCMIMQLWWAFKIHTLTNMSSLTQWFEDYHNGLLWNYCFYCIYDQINAAFERQSKCTQKLLF